MGGEQTHMGANGADVGSERTEPMFWGVWGIAAQSGGLRQAFARAAGVRHGLAHGLLAFGLFGAAPAEAEAEESCNTKPAVCARLKAERRNRPHGSPPILPPMPPLRTCTTKPAVCARLMAQGAWPAEPVPVVTMTSRNLDPGKCTSKPAVCARLKAERAIRQRRAQ
jgi:hypothetical protein